ncbi:hypothetical protein MC885_010071 [Smutsia gigantea]|nr:hypothetical protein MC885_010071 [Smutsia gigantea]
MRDSGEPTGPMLNGSTYMVRPVEDNAIWMRVPTCSFLQHPCFCVPAVVTLHAAWKPLIHSLLELSWGHPVAQLPMGPTSRDGHCVPLRRSYNHRLALYSCHILGVCAGQPAGGEGIIRKIKPKIASVKAAAPILWGHWAPGLPVIVFGELSDESLLLQQGQHGSVLSLRPITDVDALWLAQAGTAFHKVSNPSRQLAQIPTEYLQGAPHPS